MSNGSFSSIRSVSGGKSITTFMGKSGTGIHLGENLTRESFSIALESNQLNITQSAMHASNLAATDKQSTLKPCGKSTYQRVTT
jgi:hypothetical protein